MSRSIVRRLTAAIILVTALCCALPALASPVRSHTAHTPMVLGTGVFFDQILSWLVNLLPGQEPKPEEPAAKRGVLPTMENILNQAPSLPIDPARGAQIDPNGSH